MYKLSKESVEKNRSDDLKAMTKRAEQRETELNAIIDNLETRHGNTDAAASLTSAVVERVLHVDYIYVHVYTSILSGCYYYKIVNWHLAMLY